MGLKGAAYLACALAIATTSLLPTQVTGNAAVATRGSPDFGDIGVGPPAGPPTFTDSPQNGVHVDDVDEEADGSSRSKDSHSEGSEGRGRGKKGNDRGDDGSSGDDGSGDGGSGASFMSDYILSRVVKYWHGVAVEAAREDYSHEGQAPEANGPCYASRISAMVHVAMYDAYVGITKEGSMYNTYDQDPPDVDSEETSYTYYFMYRRNGKVKTKKKSGKGRSLRSHLKVIRLAYSAVAQTAYETLAEGYPKQQGALKSALDTYFRSFFKLQEGKDWGSHVAQKVIAERADDGHDAGPMFADFPPGPYALWEHQPDPTIHPTQPQYAPHWGDVKPFGFSGQMDGKVMDMPSPHDEKYTEEYIEVKEVGAKDSETRTEEQTHIGLEWAYDGSYKIGTPIRMYNQVIDAIIESAEHKGKYKKKMRSAYHLVKLYAATNVAMADAAISAWKEKYRFNFWRPIVGIRHGDEDDLEGTKGDEDWLPLGSPLTNTIKMSVTPAFPSYPSGHATIGTAGMKTARLLMGLDDGFRFSWMSDEMNGEARDADGTTRPRIVLDMSIQEAIDYNKVSRVYLGVHWHFDCERGTELGYSIAHQVADNFPGKA